MLLVICFIISMRLYNICKIQLSYRSAFSLTYISCTRYFVLNIVLPLKLIFIFFFFTNIYYIAYLIPSLDYRDMLTLSSANKQEDGSSGRLDADL